MYQITKATMSIINSVLYGKEPVMIVNCSEEELTKNIMPKLAQLAAAENLKYHKVNSNSRIVFVVKELSCNSAKDAILTMNFNIQDIINAHNEDVKAHNVLVRRGNKKYSKPLESGTLIEVNLGPYMANIHFNNNYKFDADEVIIKEGI